MDNTISEIQRKLREPGSTEVLEGIHSAGQLTELPSILVDEILTIFSRDFDDFVYTQAMRTLSHFKVQDHCIEVFLTSSIQNASLKGQNKKSRIVPLNTNCLCFALEAAINLNVPGPELIAAIVSFVKVKINPENFILCLEFLNRHQTKAQFRKLVGEIEKRESVAKILKRVFDMVGKQAHLSEFLVIDDERVFAVSREWHQVSQEFQRIISEISFVGEAPSFLKFKSPEIYPRSSPRVCPKCEADNWIGTFAFNHSVLKCQQCSQFYTCTGYYSENAPGHEEHDRAVYVLVPIDFPMGNKPCPCGKGNSFSKCCKEKLTKTAKS
jgi:hypothetical protein